MGETPQTCPHCHGSQPSAPQGESTTGEGKRMGLTHLSLFSGGNCGRQRGVCKQVRHTVVSLFAGAGLMDHGFEQVGCEVVAACEWDKQAVATWRHNRPGMEERMVHADICKVTAADLGVSPGEVWAVIGGPPCQGFSQANSNRAHKNGNIGAWRDDPRNLLYREFLRLVTEIQPRLFVMENVKPMFTTGSEATGQPGPIMREVLSDFTAAGYRCAAQVLDAADYGVPQHRERTIVIGVRADLPDAIRYPAQTHGGHGSSYPYWRTVREALAGLPEPGAGGPIPPKAVLGNHGSYAPLGSGTYDQGHRSLRMDEPAPTIPAHHNTDVPILPANHEPNELPADWIERNQERWAKRWGGMPALDVDLPAPTIGASAGSNLSQEPFLAVPLNHYGAMAVKPDGYSVNQKNYVAGPDTPSGTINCNHLDHPPIHHANPRRLSPRECARLQTVPDDYYFCGSKSAAYRAVGNGVPCELARRIAAVLAGAENGREVGPYAVQQTLFNLLAD